MELALSLLIVAVTALVVYAIIKTNPAKPMQLPARPATPYEPALPAAAPALHWSDDGRYLVDVMNESRYQPALKELAGAHGDAAAAVPYLATLAPDDLNPYESAAVAVFLNGRMTGYLSPKASVAFRARLRAKEIAGQPTSCDAQVRGGGLWQGKRLSYVVVLDMEPLEP
jgi:hypothetical protein